MEIRPTGRKIPIKTAIIWGLFLVLITAVFLQYRYIMQIKGDLNKSDLSGRSRTISSVKERASGFKRDHSSFMLNRKSEDNISDKEKIEMLESRIADMQAWQDFLEEALERQKNEEEWNNDIVISMSRSLISARVDGFAEEAYLSPDIKSKLFNILFEKESEMRDIYSGDVPGEDRKKELEYLSQKYDERISDLLLNKYDAYKEYLKVQAERNYISDYKNSMLTGDNQLEKQQEQRLIAALYNENQAFKKLLEEKEQILHNENLADSVKRKEYLDAWKSLYNSYTDSARDILSESQLKKFQKFLEVELSRQEMHVNTTIGNMSYSENKDDD